MLVALIMLLACTNPPMLKFLPWRTDLPREYDGLPERWMLWGQIVVCFLLEGFPAALDAPAQAAAEEAKAKGAAAPAHAPVTPTAARRPMTLPYRRRTMWHHGAPQLPHAEAAWKALLQAAEDTVWVPLELCHACTCDPEHHSPQPPSHHAPDNSPRCRKSHPPNRKTTTPASAQKPAPAAPHIQHTTGRGAQWSGWHRPWCRK